MHFIKSNILFIVFLFVCGSLKSQTIQTIAGNPLGLPFYEGADASDINIGFPGYCNFDSKGNLYFGSDRFVIRKIDNFGKIYTVVGDGTFGNSGDGGFATSAQIGLPGGIVFDDSDNLYFCDLNNNCVRKVYNNTGIITRYAGTSIPGFGGDMGHAADARLSQPTSIVFDKIGNMYIGDGGNYRIRKIDKLGIITTIAGTGLAGYSGDGGPAINAKLEGIGELVIDSKDNLIIACSNTIRKIDLNSNIISTVSGSNNIGYSGNGGLAVNADMRTALHLAVDYKGWIFVTERYNHIVRYINSDGIINTIVGLGISGYSGDGGNANDAQINHPTDICFDSCYNLILLDAENRRIRKVTFNPECLPLNVTDVNSEVREVKVYPNPMQDELNVRSEEAIQEVALYNAVGQLVLHIAGGGQRSARLAVGQLPAGVYMVRVNGQNVNRIVKQ